MVVGLRKSNILVKSHRASAFSSNSHVSSVSPFSSESDLVNTFDRITNFDVKNYSGLIHELDSTNGIADISLYRLRKDWSEHQGIKDIKPQWVSFLVSLPYRKLFTTNEAAALASISGTSASKILREFVKNGYCKKSGNVWIKLKQPRAPITHIAAVEAKLKNWKRALYQAFRYLEFANESWVLLDEYHSIPAISNLSEFKKRNIGLLTINQDGIVTIEFQPSRKAPKSKFSYWYACTKILKDIPN